MQKLMQKKITFHLLQNEVSLCFKPWVLAAMEDEGYMDTSDGLVNRVAKYLAKSPNDTIGTAEFRSACIACNVDPINSDVIHYETMGEILGMKWTDSLLPNVKLGPEWGYEGLQEFCKFYKINLTDTLKEALAKLK